jgi:hypothetical protein
MARRASQHVDDVARIAGRLIDLEDQSRRTLSRAERADARAWYVAQRLRLERIAAEFGFCRGPEAVIHAAATLSPATAWAVVLRDLPGFIRAALDGDPVPPFATYGRQRALAARIIREGMDWTGGAKGPKVRPFALALMGDDSQVVVDRHVARYALDEPDRITVTVRERRAIVDAHKVAGTALGIPPRDLQSLLWVARVGYDGDPGGARLKASDRARIRELADDIDAPNPTGSEQFA